MLVNQRKHLSSISPTSLSFPELSTAQPHLVVSFIIQLVKKSSAMVFILGDKGYPFGRFEYKKASERYMIAEL